MHTDLFNARRIPHSTANLGMIKMPQLRTTALTSETPEPMAVEYLPMKVYQWINLFIWATGTNNWELKTSLLALTGLV